VDLCNDVPLWGLIDIALNLRVIFPPKTPIFGACIRIFKPNV